jgi:hypothetical protein
MLCIYQIDQLAYERRWCVLSESEFLEHEHANTFSSNLPIFLVVCKSRIIDRYQRSRIRISKKNRQHNGQKKKYKWTNNDLQIITSKVSQSPPWLGWPLWNICVTTDHGYVPLINVNTSRYMAKRKKYKRTNNDQQNIHIKLKIE